LWIVIQYHWIYKESTVRVAKYLDELQRTLGVKTDKEVAEQMGWTHSVPSNWRKGRSFMTNQTAGQLSAILGVPVMHIIAAVEADREEVTGQRSFWTDFFTRTTAASAVVVIAVVTNFVTPSPAQAAPRLENGAGSVYLMSTNVAMPHQVPRAHLLKNTPTSWLHTSDLTR
jgi:hypothetical protein